MRARAIFLYAGIARSCSFDEGYAVTTSILFGIDWLSQRLDPLNLFRYALVVVYREVTTQALAGPLASKRINKLAVLLCEWTCLTFDVML